MKILLLIFTVLFSANAYAGCDEGDCVNGKGKNTWPEGDVYEGDFLKGKFISSCTEGMDSVVIHMIHTAKLKNAKANQLGFDSVKDETL